MSSVIAPPPVIDSALVLDFAHVSEEITFCGEMHLHAFGKWVVRVANLAICRNYGEPQDILLLFCDSDWNSEGCIPCSDMNEAKSVAEKDYPGLGPHWVSSPHNEAAIHDFLRSNYGVDPATEWWCNGEQ